MPRMIKTAAHGGTVYGCVPLFVAAASDRHVGILFSDELNNIAATTICFLHFSEIEQRAP